MDSLKTYFEFSQKNLMYAYFISEISDKVAHLKMLLTNFHSTKI